MAQHCYGSKLFLTFLQDELKAIENLKKMRQGKGESPEREWMQQQQCPSPNFLDDTGTSEGEGSAQLTSLG